jgi:hypothetical protein
MNFMLYIWQVHKGISTTDSTSVLFHVLCGPLSLHWVSQVDEGITTIRSEHLAVAL